MTIETAPEIFEVHQAMVADAERSNWSFIDDRDKSIIPLLRALNRHPDVKTRWSCSGHLNDDSSTCGDCGEIDGYVAMSVRGDGFKFLLDLHSHLLRSNIFLDYFPNSLPRPVTLRIDSLYSDINLGLLHSAAVRKTADVLYGWKAVMFIFTNTIQLTSEQRSSFYNDLAEIVEERLRAMSVV